MEKCVGAVRRAGRADVQTFDFCGVWELCFFVFFGSLDVWIVGFLELSLIRVNEIPTKIASKKETKVPKHPKSKVSNTQNFKKT